MESIWTEIRGTHYDESEKTICIDAWETTDENEEGKVIAKVWTDNNTVEYLDPRAETDPYAKAVIRNVLDELETGEEPEPESLHISVDFHLLMREGETVDEALQRFMEVVLDDLANLAEHHIDWNLAENYAD